jgi:shikimate dehydrogenase
MEVMKFAVLGDPISHSKSPVIHQAAYDFIGLDWSYERHQVTSADLGKFLNSALDHFDGFSLTMPLKVELVAIAKERGWLLDSFCTQLGVANTLYKVNGGDWRVANTDVHGAAMALTSVGAQVKSAALLGSGATAKSIALALSLQNASLAELTIFSRRPQPAEEIFEMVGIELPNAKCSWLPLEAAGDFGGADLTINTLPGSAINEYEVDRSFGESWVFDVTYEPWPTPLAEAWPEQNRISGLEMLIWQAIEQLRLFGAIPSTFDSGKIAELAGAMRDSVR